MCVVEVLKETEEAHHPHGHHCEQVIQTGIVKELQEAVKRRHGSGATASLGHSKWSKVRRDGLQGVFRCAMNVDILWSFSVCVHSLHI